MKIYCFIIPPRVPFLIRFQCDVLSLQSDLEGAGMYSNPDYLPFSVYSILFRAPFDLSLCVLIMMSILLVFTWTENYGDTTVGNTQSYKNAFSAIVNGRH